MMEYFAGLDVSLRSCALCIVDNKGKVLFERELPCEVFPIRLTEPSAHRPRDFVPWRFSDADKHRAWFKRSDAASEKPAHL